MRRPARLARARQPRSAGGLTAVTAVALQPRVERARGAAVQAGDPTFGEPARGWLILAMASTLAGNLTIVGSVANLIVVEEARGARIDIGFLEYAQGRRPVTLVTLLLGWLILVFMPV